MPTVSLHSPCPTDLLPPPPEEPRGDATADAGAGDGEIPALDKQHHVGGGSEEWKPADGGGGGWKPVAAEAMRKYHGVMRLESNGKYEAYFSKNSQADGHIDKVCLGSYDVEEHAARAYDLADLKYWGTGPDTKLNFAISDYDKELESMKTMSEDELMAYIMRQSSCFSRGMSPKCGVTSLKGQARTVRTADSKSIYLGTFSNQEEAAEAYDIAAIK